MGVGGRDGDAARTCVSSVLSRRPRALSVRNQRRVVACRMHGMEYSLRL